MAENNNMLSLERDHAWKEYQSINKKLCGLQETHEKLTNKLKQVSDELAKSTNKYESQNVTLNNTNNILETKLSKRDTEVKSLTNRIQKTSLTIQEITKQRNHFHQQCSVLEQLMLQHQKHTDILFRKSCEMMVKAWEPILSRFRDIEPSYNTRIINCMNQIA